MYAIAIPTPDGLLYLTSTYPALCWSADSRNALPIDCNAGNRIRLLGRAVPAAARLVRVERGSARSHFARHSRGARGLYAAEQPIALLDYYPHVSEDMGAA